MSGVTFGTPYKIGRQLIQPVEVRADLPHVIELALAADAAGKEAKSTKQRGCGVAFPFTSHSEGVARLWAIWDRRRNGHSSLAGFEIRLGRDRAGPSLCTLRLRDDGLLRCSTNWYSDRPGWPERRMQLEELQARLDEMEAAAETDDPIGLMSANAVSAASVSWCMCCGRALTDPLSVRTGIGPECGSTMHARFLHAWRAARAGMPSPSQTAAHARARIMDEFPAKVLEIHPDTGGEAEGAGGRMVAVQAERDALLKQLDMFAEARP